MKNHDIMSYTFLCVLFTLGFCAFTIIPAIALEKPTGKVVWEDCPSGSEMHVVIRCRIEGGDACDDEWETYCNGDPVEHND